MELDLLITQVKKKLRDKACYDMRTFDYHHFEHLTGHHYETVEFYVYEKPTCPNRQYVTLTYDLMTGKRLFTLTNNHSFPKEKQVAGFERAGKTYLFSEENPEAKVFAKLLAGKLMKMKDFPETEELKTYKENKFLQEINVLEDQVLALTKANFEDLRDFVRHNI